MDGYAFEAEMTRVVPIGLVPEGLRLNAYYQGRITEGPLTGDTVDGVDYFLLRRDGVGVLDVWDGNDRAIRFYERRGVVPKPARRPSGFREYPASTVERIRLLGSAGKA